MTIQWWSNPDLLWAGYALLVPCALEIVPGSVLLLNVLANNPDGVRTWRTISLWVDGGIAIVVLGLAAVYASALWGPGLFALTQAILDIVPFPMESRIYARTASVRSPGESSWCVDFADGNQRITGEREPQQVPPLVLAYRVHL